MNGGYIYGDENMLGAILDAISKAQSSATYKNAFHEAKRLLDSGKPVFLKKGNTISSVLAISGDEGSIMMYIFIESVKFLVFEASTPDTIEIS